MAVHSVGGAVFHKTEMDGCFLPKSLAGGVSSITEFHLHVIKILTRFNCEKVYTACENFSLDRNNYIFANAIKIAI